jgi:dTDP-4-dehydrorhamnose reductase
LPMRILVTGGGGQLAYDLTRALPEHEVVALAREELDVTNPGHVSSAIDGWSPQVVINTAAFHKVDLCEEEPEQSFAVNAAAPQRLAARCKQRGALLVHVSTDYVFDGLKMAPYVETDPVAPLSVYGASKAAGEMAIRATTELHLIIRTSGLYGIGGTKTKHGNFVETMVRLGQQGQPIQVVADQVLTPSYAKDVAVVIAELLEREATGTFHVTNRGECSWFEFAVELFKLANVAAEVSRTTQAERPMPAQRPAYSVLAHDGLRRLGIEEPRSWEDALADYVVSREPLVSEG